jgi:histidinol-phosphate aminotransferase
VPEPRKAVRRMAPYSPPSGGRAGKLRLDFNENTCGASPRVTEALRRYLTADALAVYPEYVETKPALASFFGVTPDQFLLTNGTDEAIQVLVSTFVNAGDDVLILKPAYAMYRFYSELAGSVVREVAYRSGDLSFPLDELIAAIQPETRAILISNPNNPTGTLLRDVRPVLDAAPHAAVLIDEAYFEFCGVTALPLLAEYPNLFVSRTFSKVYGMAAMRVGCLFSQAANVAWMHKAQSPYSVNMLGAIAARAAIEDTESVRRYVAQVLAARELCYRGLDRLGVRHWKSDGNFVLFESPLPPKQLVTALRECGLLVRDRSHELPDAVRVTIGTPEQTERFLAELEALL